MRRVVILVLLLMLCPLASYAQPRAVFMGDSIFDSWDSPKHGGHPEFFADNNFVNRGKSGQVTAQMLERFTTDVVEFAPQTVIICAGTNDIAQNKGYVPNRQIMKNIKTMTRLASKADIEVVLCTILPAARYRWRPEIEPVESIRDMNRRIRRYAKWHRLPLVDFYTTLAAADGSLPSHLSKDGVHPNSDCYTIMEPLILSVLE